MIAYLISAFKDPAFLARMVSALNSADTDFYVHIDKAVDITPFKQVCRSANVTFLSNRVNVYWGTYSQVEFQMRMLQAALQSGKAYNRLFMLSGQDYPLWSNAHIRKYLAASGRHELISGLCLESDAVEERHKQMYRLVRPQTDMGWLGAKWNDRLSKGLRRVLKICRVRKPLHLDVDGQRWPIYKGSDYFCLSGELARYVVDTWQRQPAIRRYFKTSFAPSETCIQTIVFNHSEYRRRADLHSGGYTTLKDLTLLHHIDYIPVIRVWKAGDFEQLQASGKPFARKFETGASDELLEEIDRHRKETTSDIL